MSGFHHNGDAELKTRLRNQNNISKAIHFHNTVNKTTGMFSLEIKTSLTAAQSVCQTLTLLVRPAT